MTPEQTCEGCNGTGRALNYFAASDWFEQECSHCGGTGIDDPLPEETR